jgi:hypothetical protein
MTKPSLLTPPGIGAALSHLIENWEKHLEKLEKIGLEDAMRSESNRNEARKVLNTYAEELRLSLSSLQVSTEQWRLLVCRLQDHESRISRLEGSLNKLGGSMQRFSVWADAISDGPGPSKK